jgi:hypothetical protein
MTTATPQIRKPWRQRITTIVWGGLITAAGVLTAYALNGVHIDVELVAIVALAALGGWLLLSALFSSRPRPTPALTSTTDTSGQQD